MSYPFPSELRQLVEQGLATNHYRNEDEMLLEAVRLLHQRDTHFGQFEENLKARLDRLDRGEAIELEDDQALREFFDDVQARGRQRYEASKNAP